MTKSKCLFVNVFIWLWATYCNYHIIELIFCESWAVKITRFFCNICLMIYIEFNLTYVFMCHAVIDCRYVEAKLSPLLGMCVQWEILLGGASFVSLAGQHIFCPQNCDNQAVICKQISVYIFRIGPIYGGFIFLLKKHENLWKNKTSECSFVSLGHHPALTTNIFTSIWHIEDKQEMWWPAKHSTECPPTAHISRGGQCNGKYSKCFDGSFISTLNKLLT